MLGVPRAMGLPETLAELADGGLGDEARRHLAVADVEVGGSRSFPAECLMGVEEFFDMPSFRVAETEKRLGDLERLGGFVAAIAAHLAFAVAAHAMRVNGQQLADEVSACSPQQTEGHLEPLRVGDGVGVEPVHWHSRSQVPRRRCSGTRSHRPSRFPETLSAKSWRSPRSMLAGSEGSDRTRALVR